MVIETSLNNLVRDIKKNPGYKNWKKQFEDWVATKDRVNDWLKYFLIYDIDKRHFMMRSEYNITHNQIALIEAYLPPKRDKHKEIEFKEYDYKIGAIENKE
jgi:hypothetical protein